MSRMRCLRRALRDCQPTPPSRSSCTPDFVRAIAAQELDILDRQIELVAARIMHFEAIVRLARRLDGREAGEAADAVVGMDHEVADREARHFGEHVAAALRPRLAHQAIAENVLLADHGKSPAPRNPVSSGSTATAVAQARQRERLGEARHALRSRRRHARQEARQAARARHCSSRRRARACPRRAGAWHASPPRRTRSAPSVWRSAAKVRPCLPPKDTMWRLAARDARTDRARSPGGSRARSCHSDSLEEQALWRHGMIWRRAEGLALECLCARIVVVGDLFEPFRCAHRR